MFDQLDIPVDCEIVSVQEGDNPSDAIYSITEGENEEDLYQNINTIVHEHIYALREESERTFLIGPTEGYRAMVKVNQKQYNCNHLWENNTEIPEENVNCHCCKRETQKRHRTYCSLCKSVVCGMCSLYYYERKISVAQKNPIRYNPHELIREQQQYITYCDAEICRLKSELKSANEAQESIQTLQQKAKEAIEESLKQKEEIQ